MKKEREIENGTQLSLDEALGIKVEQKQPQLAPETVSYSERESTMLNDAGEEISVENGYAPADVEELERLAREDEENAL